MRVDKYNIFKHLAIGVCVHFFYSCGGSGFVTSKCVRSPVLELYTGIGYNMEMELLLRHSDKSYIYHTKFLGMEIGTWKRVKDSLFLYPQMYVTDDHDGCEMYKGLPWEYPVDTLDINIPYRLYIYDGKDNIVDHTLAHFHIESDPRDDYYYTSTPLRKRKIQATREEKDVLKCRRLYGGRFFGGD